MNMIRKLGGGGDVEVERMMDNAALLGIDLIELVYTPRNNMPCPSIVEVVGYWTPVIDRSGAFNEDSITDSGWIEGTLKFFPDPNGRCWGYVYNSPENKRLIATSIQNGWFKIVDKSIREELIKIAQELGCPTEPPAPTEFLYKKSKREKESDEHIKNLKEKLEQYEARIKKFQEELNSATATKQEIVERKLKGVKLPNRDKILNGDEE